MATFRASNGLPTLTGDVLTDVAGLRDGVFSLEEELRYIFSNLGTDNMNGTEWQRFLTDRDETAAKRVEAAAQNTLSTVNEAVKTVAALSESLSSLGQIVGALAAAVEDTRNQMGLMAADLSAIEAWRTKVVTEVTAVREEPLEVIPNGVSDLVSLELEPGTYFVSAAAEFGGEGIENAELNLRLFCGGTESGAARYGGSPTLTVYQMFDLTEGGTVKLRANHRGEHVLTCARGTLTALMMRGGEEG